MIGEVAVSFVLLIGAGLLINSFFHLRNLDPGFRADHLLTMKVDLSEVKYPDRERRAAFFDEVMRRVHALADAARFSDLRACAGLPRAFRCCHR